MIRYILFMMLLFSIVFSAYGQDDDLIDRAVDALNAFEAQSSYQFVGKQVLNYGYLDPNGALFNQRVSSDLDFRFEIDSDGNEQRQLLSVTETDLGLEGVSNPVATNETLLIEGTYYTRTTVDMPNVPSQWYSYPAESETLTTGDPLGLGLSVNVLEISALYYDIEEDSVLEIIALPNDTIDEQTMQVMLITYDYEQILAPEVVDTIISENSEEFLQALMGSFELNQTLWIGEVDGLVYRIQVEFLVDLSDFPFPFAPAPEGGVTLQLQTLSTSSVVDVLPLDAPLELLVPDGVIPLQSVQ